MDVNENLAAWSNLLIYSAMAVYALAFIIYSFDLFGGRRLATRHPAHQTAIARTTRKAKPAVRRTSRRGSTAVLDAPAPPTDEDAAPTGPTETPSGIARRRMARIGTGLTVLALALHLAAVLTRTLSVMRVPWGNMMEYALTASALITLVYLLVLRWRDVRYLGTFVAGFVLVALGLAITVFYTPAAQLIPALDSYWIVIHVPIAILSTALLAISALLAGFQIVRARTEQRSPGRLLAFMKRLPASSEIEQTSYHLAAVGFITWTFTLIAGAIWAEVAWVRYWGWDTKEIWTFVVWVVYAAYLHARATRGWGPTRVAALNLIGFATVIFNFAVVNVYFSGLHSYSGI